MALVDLKIPPGVYRNGTDLQGEGRWRDVNLVRWHDGLMRPVGVGVNLPLLLLTRRGMLPTDNSSNRYIAFTYKAFCIQQRRCKI